jgi:hypothetical protein
MSGQAARATFLPPGSVFDKADVARSAGHLVLQDERKRC